MFRLQGATATATPAAGVPALHRASPLPLFVPRRAYVSPRRRRVYSSEEYSSDEYSSDGYSSGQVTTDPSKPVLFVLVLVLIGKAVWA